MNGHLSSEHHYNVNGYNTKDSDYYAERNGECKNECPVNTHTKCSDGKEKPRSAFAVVRQSPPRNTQQQNWQHLTVQC